MSTLGHDCDVRLIKNESFLHLKLLISTLQQNRVVIYPGHHFQTQTTQQQQRNSVNGYPTIHKPQSN